MPCRPARARCRHSWPAPFQSPDDCEEAATTVPARTPPSHLRASQEALRPKPKPSSCHPAQLDAGVCHRCFFSISIPSHPPPPQISIHPSTILRQNPRQRRPRLPLSRSSLFCTARHKSIHSVRCAICSRLRPTLFSPFCASNTTLHALTDHRVVSCRFACRSSPPAASLPNASTASGIEARHFEQHTCTGYEALDDLSPSPVAPLDSSLPPVPNSRLFACQPQFPHPLLSPLPARVVL